LLPPGKFPRFALVVAGVVAILLVVNFASDQAPSARLLYGNLLDLAMVAWAAVCTFQVARRSAGYARQVWLLLGVALTLQSGAQAISTYYQSFVSNAAQIPWPSDVLYFIWFAPLIITLLPTPKRKPGEIDWQRVLDFTQIAIVALTAYIYFFYIPSLWKVAGAMLARRILWLYLVRDVSLLVAFFLRSRTDSALWLRKFCAGVAILFFAQVFSDAVYLSTWKSPSERAVWADGTWVLPYLIVVVFAAMWTSGDEPAAPDEKRLRRSVIISQALTVCVPFLVVFMSYRIASEQRTIAGIAIAASFACSALRLILTNHRQHQIARELRETERALRQSEAMFASAFRFSPDAFSITTFPEGCYIDVNDGFLRLTGYSREEVIGRTALELDIWPDVSERVKIVAQFAERGEVRDAECRFQTKSGELRTGQYSGSVVELDGRICLVVTVRDVTIRKAADEVLRSSVERFRSAVQSLHVGIVTFGPRGEIQFANRAALDTFGLEANDVVGKTGPQIGVIPVWENGIDVPFESRPVPVVLATKKPIQNQVFGWRNVRSRSIMWTLLDAVPELDADGQLIRVLMSLTDITHQRQAGAALRASEERFRTLVRDLHVGIVLYNATGEIQYANQAALDMFGHSAAQVLGKTSIALGMQAIRADGSPYPTEMFPVPRVLRTGETIRNEVMGWRKGTDGEVVWILGNGVPQFDDGGAVNAVIGSFTDISSLKNAEQSLHQLSTRLLRLQDEERRRIGRELHDGLAQSVLAVNLNLAQVRRSTIPLDENSERALGKARNVLQQMSQEIRTLSYLLHPPLLDDLGLATAVKEYAIGFGERSGITTEVELQPEFARIHQDAETALFRIVQEALTNIQRHSGSKTARICLRRDAVRATLEISDHGCGMNGTQHGDRSQGSARLGVGILGMRERVAQLGGVLQIESNASGTTVKVTIPLPS
jgi:PAS domain S-box-containing protein